MQERGRAASALCVVSEMTVFEECPDLTVRRGMIGQKAVGQGQRDMIGCLSKAGGGDADFAIARRGDEPADGEREQWLVTRNDADRIIDMTQHRIDGGGSLGEERGGCLTQDAAQQGLSVQEVCDFAAAIGRAEHDDAAKIFRPFAMDERAGDKAAH